MCMCTEGLLSTHYHVRDSACAHFISEAREDTVSILTWETRLKDAKKCADSVKSSHGVPAPPLVGYTGTGAHTHAHALEHKCSRMLIPVPLCAHSDSPG